MMEEDASDASPRHRKTSVRPQRPSQPSPLKLQAAAPSFRGPSAILWSSTSPSQSTTAHVPRPVDRTVHTRSQFRITFPADESPLNEGHMSGWSSPHALPYRPLGKPDLNMKLSPNLRSANVRNESQVSRKSADARSNDVIHPLLARENPAAVVEEGSGIKPHALLPAYSPAHVKHLKCPPRLTSDPSFAVLQQAIHDCSLRVCTVKHGTSAFSRTIVPHGAADVTRVVPPSDLPVVVDDVYLPYTTRKPQMFPVLPLATFQQYVANAEAAAPPPGTSALGRTNHVAAMSSASSARHLHHHHPLTTSPTNIVHHKTATQRLTTMTTAAGGDVLPPEAKAAQCVDKLSKSLDNVLGPNRVGHRPSNYTSTIAALGSDPLASTTTTNSMPTTTTTTPPSSSVDGVATSLHGIERLQHVIDAREAMKQLFSQDLLVLLQSLERGRWSCFCIKFASFHTHRDLAVALFRMNERSEATRRANMQTVLADTAWYTGLLALVATATPVGQSPPTACAFVIDTIRKVIAEGHALQPAVLCSLVLCLTRDELALDSTQAVLKYLRGVVNLSLDAWGAFFSQAKLQPPREVLEKRVSFEMAARKRSKMNFARIKQVIKNKAIMETLVKPRLQMLKRQQPSSSSGFVSRGSKIDKRVLDDADEIVSGGVG
ncbi:Aste57867_17375 [Aphanomyces stellatus]|uniref:Aste57867_17375 protein n=1 Tax=Aphanomyces stellatus TaxID=120398 RepID=A0A485L7J9_9STRA|nr:hypothetical protein As57867_017315 [Aphanomyces stellatus]VFT94131.1 Aste57867_17375 [Aphanomyces stellatus]